MNALTFWESQNRPPVLVASDDDGKLSLFCARKHTLIRRLDVHERPATCICPIASQDIVLSGGEDYLVKRVDLELGRTISTHTGHTSCVSSLDANLSRYFCSSSSDGLPDKSPVHSPTSCHYLPGAGSIQLWHPSAARSCFSLRLRSEACSVRFLEHDSPHLLCTGGPDGILIWDLRRHQSYVERGITSDDGLSPLVWVPPKPSGEYYLLFHPTLPSPRTGSGPLLSPSCEPSRLTRTLAEPDPYIAMWSAPPVRARAAVPAALPRASSLWPGVTLPNCGLVTALVGGDGQAAGFADVREAGSARRGGGEDDRLVDSEPTRERESVSCTATWTDAGVFAAPLEAELPLKPPRGEDASPCERPLGLQFPFPQGSLGLLWLGKKRI